MSTSASEKKRQEQLEKKRTEMLAEYASQRAALEAAGAKNHTGADRFVKVTEGVEERLKKWTVGLVNAEDFKRVRLELEEENRRKAAQTNELEKEEKKKRKKKDKKIVNTLSFGADEDEELEHQNGASTSNGKGKTKANGTNGNHDDNGAEEDSDLSAPSAKKPKFSKNPAVDTSFLPDRVREEKERIIREELRQKYLKEQEEVKKQDIDIVCSYWDGSGHRTVVTCKKGDTVAKFLDNARNNFNELRQTSVDNLMYIKEDLIIPHHYTFYDFIVSKARGKSGPLFNFDVHEDVRMIHDASVEKNESHAGKIVERGWYNRNKHVFPSSRWEMFDPEKKYGDYRIGDRKKKKDE